MICLKPNHSADLIIVPKLPGSLIESNNIYCEFFFNSLFFISKTPRCLFGDFKKLICFNCDKLIFTVLSNKLKSSGCVENNFFNL